MQFTKYSNWTTKQERLRERKRERGGEREWEGDRKKRERERERGRERVRERERERGGDISMILLLCKLTGKTMQFIVHYLKSKCLIT